MHGPIIFLTVVDPRACGGGRGHADPRSPRVLVCVYYYSRYFMLRLYSRVASVRYNTRLFKVLLVEVPHI